MAGRPITTPSWSRRHAEDIRTVRGLVLLFLGIFILIHETLLVTEPRPYLIGAGLALCGLEAALRLDSLNGAKR